MTWRRALVAGCVAYALARFAVSGVYTPLGEPNLAQVEVWVAPLRLAQRTGGAVELSKPTPYGPVFFATMAPLLRCCGAEPRRLALGLYALQLVALAAALLFTWRSIRGWFIPGADRRGDGIGRGEALALMLFLWLTFAPLYYIMSTKNVETWELGLLAAGLAAYLRGWRSAAGLCVAAAALTKTIPFFFLLYFLIRDRRTLLHTVGWTAGILSLGHVLSAPRSGSSIFRP